MNQSDDSDKKMSKSNHMYIYSICNVSKIFGPVTKGIKVMHAVIFSNRFIVRARQVSGQLKFHRPVSISIYLWYFMYLQVTAVSRIVTRGCLCVTHVILGEIETFWSKTVIYRDLNYFI